MTDNVIILGAGFSYDSGIPLLKDFIDKMYEYYIRKNIDKNSLKILNDFIDIRNDLLSYHRLASFDDANIEDILSILSFLEIGNNDKMNIMSKAIARTIELSCNIVHYYKMNGILYKLINNTNNVVQHIEKKIYHIFWESIFKRPSQILCK